MNVVAVSPEPAAHAAAAARPQASGLREALRRRDELTDVGEEYYGITQLTIKDSDPTRYERFCSALQVGLVSAREVSKFVSASPGSREMGELLFGLLTPEGDPIGISLGLAGNIACFPVGVRWMIVNDYEDNPRIREGDIFSGDDPGTSGAIHPGDCFTYLPIFHSGALVAWACGMNHIIEVGSMLGGSWPAFSQDAFTDGFMFPLTKTGENYEYHAWWLETWKRRTRAPVFNILDEKMRLSGCQMIERKVHEVIDEFGTDYFREGIREIIEDTRLAVKRNVRAHSVPGRSRNVTFRTAGQTGVGNLFPLANREYLIHVPVQSEVDGDGGLHTDVSGASPWGFHAYNSFHAGLAAAVHLSVMDSYGHDTKLNHGLMEHSKVTAELGSLFNPDYPYVSSSNPWATTVSVISAAINNSSRNFCGRGFLEECWTGEASWDGAQGSGILPNGAGWGFTNLQFVGAAGQGAYAYKDGQPTSWTCWNHRSDIGNVEEWEYVTPALYYLGRGLVPEYCGHGKHRGAVGQSAVYAILNPGKLALNRGGGTMATNTVIAVGSAGGYPAPGVFVRTLHDTNLRGLMERSEHYPTSPWEVDQFLDSGHLTARRKTIWKSDTPPIQVNDGDLYVHASGGGGGWGDPIERDPADALDDVRRGWLGAETLADVYGVVVHGEGRAAQLDEAATQRRRAEIVNERRARSVPVSQWWAQQRERVTRGDFIEQVRSMHRDCMGFDRYRAEFVSFWALEPEFAYESEEEQT